MNDILKNCAITNSNAKVRRKYVDSTSDPLYKQYKGFHDGVDLEATSVYSMFPGVVVQAGQDTDNTYSVTVRYDVNHLMQYSNLKSISVAVNQKVDTGDLLGSAKKYVHVEYLLTTSSKWPVRILGNTYYKNDPSKLLEEGAQIMINYASRWYNPQSTKYSTSDDGDSYVPGSIDPFED